jgi:prepilin-type N-terminal cleavage/methylation domain-containing protein
MRRAFTLIELLVVISIIALLIGILLPALGKARDSAKMSICSSQLRQVQIAKTAYLTEFDGVFMRHRSYENITLPDGRTREEFWFDQLQPYFDNEEGYRCPDIDSGSFEWEYNENNIGYGYNAWFLGQHPNRSDKSFSIWTAGVDLPQERLRNPSDQLVFADSELKNGTVFSLSLWFPFINSKNEGVASERHRNHGVTAFHDGHVETIKDPDNNINPPFDGSDQFIEYWDPQQRRLP